MLHKSTASHLTGQTYNNRWFITYLSTLRFAVKQSGL